MKRFKIFFSVLLFAFLLIIMPRFSLAGDATDPGKGEECCSWTAGKTSVSDLSPEEKQKRLGLKIPDWYEEWWDKLPKLQATEGVTFPPRFDWRDSNGVTPAKDQGSCGSCWDFCAVGALEAMVKIYGEVELDLSEQQVLSCKTFGWGCDGAYSELAFQLFQNPGSAKEVCMPYQADDEVPCTQTSCEKWAKISGWTAVTNNVDAIKTALLTGPVSTSMAVEDTFQSYTGGCYNKPYFGLNHCVLIVGWDDTLCGTGGWIVKNSWGKGWGMDGFFYIKYGCCQIGSYTYLINYIFHRPYVRFEGFGTDDSPTGGNGNGTPEPGETVGLDFTLKNLWTPLGDVEVTVTADTSGIVFNDNYSYLGDMDSKEILDNSSDPMEFYVPSDFPIRRTYFTFQVSGDSGGGVTYTTDTTLEVSVGRQILLVDDDQGVDGKGNNYEDYYMNAFDSLKAVYEIWDKKANPGANYDFSDFDILIWFTGDHRDSVFSHTDIESLMSFLDQGGRLFLTSQDAVEALSGSADPLFQQFLTDYLHVGYGSNSGKILTPGKLGDEIGDSLWIYPGGVASPQNQTSMDNLVPDSQSDTVCVYADAWWVLSDSVAATKFQNELFRVVVFGFGFEGINSSGLQMWGRKVSKPHLVMRRVLDWLKIPNPSITVVSPNGGEEWLIDETYVVSWESNLFQDSVKIEYSTNGGVDWMPVVDTTTNDGIYSWVIPNTPSDSCLVRISDIANGIPYDVSDGYFSMLNYVPGDPNGDGVVNSADIVSLINYLYKGGPPPNPMAAGDANGDCVINSADVVFLINYLFKGGPAPQVGCA